MKKLIAGVLVIMVCASSPVFAKIYNSFDNCDKFHAGDVIRMENSLAFPSYIYELEIKQVTKKDGSISVRGRQILTDKATGEVSVSEDYTQIVRAKKMDMNVVVNIDKPSGNSQIGRTDGSRQNKPDNVSQNDTNGSSVPNEDLSGGDGELFQLKGKKYNKDVLISPVRGLNATKDKIQAWETPESNNFTIIYIVIGIIILLLLGLIIMQNKHRLKKFKRVTLVIILFISIAINEPSICASTLCEQNFELSPYKSDYMTYGRTYERRMSSYEQQSGSYVTGWSTQQFDQTYSQPLICGNYVYYYAGNKIYKIDISTGAKTEHDGVHADNSGGPAIGNMTICGDYIFVGDRHLNISVIDKNTMQCKVGYSILEQDSGYNSGTLNGINNTYGKKGIVSAPYVRKKDSNYEVYFGTAVGFFVKLTFSSSGDLIQGATACILNSKYKCFGDSDEYASLMNNKSICIVSSPICIGTSGNFNYPSYLYIGTPYSGEKEGFSQTSGYVCRYILKESDDQNVLEVNKIIAGGVETTMAYDGTKLVFADRNGNAHGITVDSSGGLGEEFEAWLSDPTPGGPPVIGCPAVFRFGDQNTLAVFSVTNGDRFKIVDSTAGEDYFDVISDEIHVNSQIKNSPYILNMGEKVYLLYSNKNEICAKDITSCLADGGGFSDANIFKVGDNNVSQITVCEQGKYLTSDITVAYGKILVSDSGGKLHCLRFETGDGDFLIRDDEVTLWRKHKPQAGVAGEFEQMSDDPAENQVIEAGSDYVYQLRAKIKSDFTSDIDNVKVTLSAEQISSGVSSPYLFKIIKNGQEQSVQTVSYQLRVSPGDTEFRTDELRFGTDFLGEKIKFKITVNPENIPSERTPYANNTAEIEWQVWKMDLDLRINEFDIPIGRYIPLAVDMPQVPVIIYGIARNESKHKDVEKVAITLTISRNNAPSYSQTIEVDIKHKYIDYTGPDDSEYSGIKHFWFQVDQSKFAEGELHDIRIEINPKLPPVNDRKFTEANDTYPLGSPNHEKIYDNNVVTFTGVEAINRNKLGTYEDIWVDGEEIHIMKGDLFDYAMYRTDYGSKLLGYEVINAKSGYGIDLRSKYVVSHQSPNGADWPENMIIKPLEARCYIVKPRTVSDSGVYMSLSSGGMEIKNDDSILLKNLKDLDPDDIAENCIEIFYEQGQSIFAAPKYAHDYEMESNEKMRADGDEQSLQDTLEMCGRMRDSQLGPIGDEITYVCALKRCGWSPHEHRCIYPHSDTPDNEENEAYTILISMTFQADITLENGVEYKCKVRTTNLYYVLKIGGVMHNDDVTHLLG